MKFANVALMIVIVTGMTTVPAIAQTQARPRTNDPVSASLLQSTKDAFPLSLTTSCSQQGASFQGTNWSIVCRPGTVSNHGNSIVISGHGFDGNIWSAILPMTGTGSEIFTGDLSGNGLQDIVIYSPGINDRGAYGGSLTLLLFNKRGVPSPWQATGFFTTANNRIPEIVRTKDGRVVIIQTQEIGLPAWNGLSYLSHLYRINNTQVISSSESFNGIQFPHFIKAKQANSSEAEIEQQVNLSTSDNTASQNSPVNSADAYFTGVRVPVPPTAQKSGKVAPATPTGPYLAVAAGSVFGVEPQVTTSSGTNMKLPRILVVDREDGARQIYFNLAQSDFSLLVNGQYRIHSTGTSCVDTDECKPYILWAKYR